MATINKVPRAKVGQIVQSFVRDGFTKVVATKNKTNDLWTITAD
jgi:hypothetical protein